MKLADYIKGHGMTETSFAELAQMEQPTINRYVRGVRFPSPKNFTKIKTATGGKVNWADWEDSYIPQPSSAEMSK